MRAHLGTAALPALLALTSTAALPTPATAAVGDESVGLNVHHGEPAFIDAAAALGVRWVRMDGNWVDLEPSEGTYAWGALDAAIDRATMSGLQVFLTLAYTPAWVPSHGDTDGQSHNDVPNDSVAWSRFVDAAVRHFAAHGVRYFGLWNEANLQQFFEGSANDYVDLIAVPGAAAVRAACATCKVVGPELANVGDADVYLEAVMRRAGNATFDVLSHHDYGGFIETGWHIWSGDSFINQLDQQRFPFTRRSLRQVLDAVGWAGEVWITETGYRATPGDAADEDLQAIYVRRVLEEQLSRVWYTNTFFYEIHDCGPDQPACTIDGFGLMRATSGAPGTRTFPADFRQKPAFAALHDFIAQHPSIVGTAPAPQCGNGLDDDHDGRIDGADRGCTGPDDDDESNDPPRPTLLANEGGARLDAMLIEWPSDTFVTLDASTWRGTEPLGPGDLEVRAAAQWSAAGLDFAFEVTDDTHDNAHAPDELWQGDGVQLAFDVGAQGGSGYDGLDDHELSFALAGVPLTPTGYRHAGPPGATNDFTVNARRDGTTTTYELRIAPSALPGLALQGGTHLRFSFLVNDADGSGRVGWKEWTPGIGTTKEPELFGELVLVAGPPRPDAGPAPDAEPGLDRGPFADAASSGDATQLADDAATTDPDAGVTPDTGVSGDSGPLDTPILESAGGGCACDASRSGSTSADPSATLTALALLGFVLGGLRRSKR